MKATMQCDGASKIRYADVVALLDRIIAWIGACRIMKAHPAVIALFLAALSLCLAFPHFRLPYQGVPWAQEAVAQKFEHPLEPVRLDPLVGAQVAADQTGIADHLPKKSFRIAIPVTAHVLGIGMTGAIVAQQLGACVFLMLTLVMVRRLTADPMLALLGGVCVAASFLGQWGFNDFEAFDGLAYLSMMLCMWSRWPLVTALAVAYGGLIDERVILAVPLLYLFAADRDRLIEAPHLRDLLRPTRLQWGVIFGVALFGTVRLYLGYRWGAFVDTVGISNLVLKTHTIMFPLTFLNLVEGGILLVAMGAIAAILRPRYRGVLALLVLTSIPTVVTAIYVYDFSRSLAYGFPAFYLLLAVLMRVYEPGAMQRVLLIAAAVSLMMPDYYTMFGKVYYLLPIVRIL